MHAIKVLREDHARIEALLEEVAEAGEATRAGPFERLEKELTIHTIAEDNVFLPQVEEAVEDSKRTTAEFFDDAADVLGEAARLVAASYENHRGMLALLEDVAGSRTDEGIGELRRVVSLGIEAEEELFPKAERVLEGEDFERIGDLLEHCKGQVRGLAQARLASSSSFRPAPGREAALMLQESRRE